MQTILDKVTEKDILGDPYTHIVIENAIDEDLAEELLRTYPSLEHLGSGHQRLARHGKFPNNLKLRYDSSDILADTTLSSVWKEFVEAHLTPQFFQLFLNLFAEQVVTLHPHMTNFFKDLQNKDIGIKGVDKYSTKKALLNAEICADTPVVKTSSVRRPHLDHPHKLAVGLLYLREDKNDSKGGGFELYRVRKDKFKIDHTRVVKQAYLKNIEPVKLVPYKHNTLVLFLNARNAFHGVTPRSITHSPRRAFNVAFETSEKLFDLSPYAENKLITRARAHFLHLTGRHKETI